MKHYYTRLSAILSMMLIAMFMFIPSEMKAQNYAEYEKLLREYLMENDLKTNFELEAYTAIAKDKINSLKEFSKMLEQDKDKYAKDLAKRYSEEQYYDDIISIFAPYYQPHVSINDIKTILQYTRKQEVQDAVSRTNSISGDNKLVTDAFQTAVAAIMEDKGPANLPIPEGCPESYQQQFLKFFKKSPFITAINNLTTQLGAMDTSENSMLKKLITFLLENMQTIVLNAYYPTVTEKDLQVLYELFSTPEYEKIAVVTNNITSDFQQLKQNINLKYSQWLEKQLPPFARVKVLT